MLLEEPAGEDGKTVVLVQRDVLLARGLDRIAVDVREQATGLPPTLQIVGVRHYEDCDVLTGESLVLKQSVLDGLQAVLSIESEELVCSVECEDPEAPVNTCKKTLLIVVGHCERAIAWISSHHSDNYSPKEAPLVGQEILGDVLGSGADPSLHHGGEILVSSKLVREVNLSRHLRVAHEAEVVVPFADGSLKSRDESFRCHFRLLPECQSCWAGPRHENGFVLDITGGVQGRNQPRLERFKQLGILDHGTPVLQGP